MINQLYLSSQKQVLPGSPRHKRNHPEPNTYSSPGNPQKKNNSIQQPILHNHHGYPLQINEKDQGLQAVVRELNERVAKMAQKIGHHETVLLRLTQSSIENHKEEHKRSSGNPHQFIRITENLGEGINKLRRQFEEYKAGHSYSRDMHAPTRENEAKNHAFLELIHKSQEKIRQEMHSSLRKVMQFSKKTTQSTSKTSINGESLDSLEQVVKKLETFDEVERLVRKLQKNVGLNTTKIWGAIEKIESVGTSIDGHMQLVNAQVNKAINKIVTFINEKVSVPLNESMAKLTHRMDKTQLQISKIQAQINQLINKTEKMQANHGSHHFGGMIASSIRSEDSRLAQAEYRETLIAYSQEMIISERLYYIDSDGFLLDQNRFYLTKSGGERVRLDQRQINTLRHQQILK